MVDLTWQWVFLKFSQNFWPFDTPYISGSASAVVWNRLKQFLPEWRISCHVFLFWTLKKEWGCRVIEKMSWYFEGMHCIENCPVQKGCPWFFSLLVLFSAKLCLYTAITLQALKNIETLWPMHTLSQSLLLFGGSAKLYIPSAIKTQIISISGAVGGKTGKTLVLPGFRKIEPGGGSGGALQCYGGSYLARARTPRRMRHWV